MEHLVKLLIRKGADINAKSNDGKTALMLSVSSDIKLVNFFIENGGDVNLVNMQKEGTALDLALKYEWYRPIANFLRKHGGKTGEELKAEGK